MNTLKKILSLVGIFIAIKVIFFISAQLQNSRVKDVPPAYASQTSVNPAELPSRGYHRYVVGNGVSVELPESWSILSSGQIDNIKKLTPADGTPSTLTPFAALSNTDSRLNAAIFRASFSGVSFTEDDIKAASKTELDETCRIISGSLGGQLARMGMKIVNSPTCYIGELAGKTSLVMSYQRTDGKTNAIWQVEIQQIPVNNSTAIFTTSFKSGGDGRAREQLRDALQSIRLN